MTNKAVCKNKNTAISILETITERMESDTQREALKAVAEWIRERDFGNIPDTPEERRALVLKIKTEMRNGMSDKERRAEAAFYLEGIEA